MYSIRNIENINGFKGWKFVRIDKKDVDYLNKLKNEECSNCKIIVNDKIVKEIIACGEVHPDNNDLSIYDILKDSLPFFEKRPAGTSLNSKERVKMYHCFSGNTIDSQIKNNVMIHEDSKSSINCLLSSLKHPNYILIYI